MFLMALHKRQCDLCILHLCSSCYYPHHKAQACLDLFNRLRSSSINLNDHALISHAQSSKPPHSKICSGVPAIDHGKITVFCRNITHTRDFPQIPAELAFPVRILFVLPGPFHGRILCDPNACFNFLTNFKLFWPYVL